jgi:hypothetical protein
LVTKLAPPETKAAETAGSSDPKKAVETQQSPEDSEISDEMMKALAERLVVRIKQKFFASLA